MIETVDLFHDQYRTLNDLLAIAEELNPTGGFTEDGKPIPMGYIVDFYRDLAFIVLFKNGEDNETQEKIIDNAIYLHQVGDGLYEIYEIDGKVFGRIENGRHIYLVNDLINALAKKEVFRK